MSGAPKRQVRRNFHTDKQNTWGGGGVNPLNLLDPPLGVYVLGIIIMCV